MNLLHHKIFYILIIFLFNSCVKELKINEIDKNKATYYYVEGCFNNNNLIQQVIISKVGPNKEGGLLSEYLKVSMNVYLLQLSTLKKRRAFLSKKSRAWEFYHKCIPKEKYKLILVDGVGDTILNYLFVIPDTIVQLKTTLNETSATKYGTTISILDKNNNNLYSKNIQEWDSHFNSPYNIIDLNKIVFYDVEFSLKLNKIEDLPNCSPPILLNFPLSSGIYFNNYIKISSNSYIDVKNRIKSYRTGNYPIKNYQIDNKLIKGYIIPYSVSSTNSIRIPIDNDKILNYKLVDNNSNLLDKSKYYIRNYGIQNEYSKTKTQILQEYINKGKIKRRCDGYDYANYNLGNYTTFSVINNKNKTKYYYSDTVTVDLSTYPHTVTLKFKDIK